MREILKQIVQSTSAYLPNLIGALLVLIVGWLVALIASSLVRGLCNRLGLNTRLASWSAPGQTKPPDVSGGLGKGVFWLVMLLVLVAFFQVLGITLATDPLSGLLTMVFEYIPKVIGAGLLLLIAWVLATVVRLMLQRGLTAARIDERLGAGVAKEERIGLSAIIADAVFWLILLLFLPAVLGALGLEGLLQPVQTMLDKFLGFLPNVLAAGLIAVIGWFVARIVQRIVTSLVAAAGADRISERVGLASVSKIIGLVVYILILIPVVVAALNALALDAVTHPASQMLSRVLDALPGIFAAAVVLILAYVIGRLLAGFVTDLLTSIGFNNILHRLGIGQAPKPDKTAGATSTPSQIVGYVTLITIMLFAVFEASSLLGFAALSMLVTELTVFGAHIMLGVIILLIGLFLANVAAQAIKTSATAQADALALATRWAIMLLTGAMALRQMGLANDIVNMAFGIVLGAVAIAAAVAFGIGGRDIAARKLDEWTRNSKAK